MAVITWSDVTAFAPELATFDSGAQADVLAYVNTALNLSEWGSESSPQLRLARIYLAAHCATVTNGGSNPVAGPITEEQVGDISRSYGFSGTVQSTDLESTSYGRMFRFLCNHSPARAPVLL
jgi:hypothetical protein